MSTLVSIVVGIVANVLTLATSPFSNTEGMIQPVEECNKTECCVYTDQLAMSTTVLQKMK